MISNSSKIYAGNREVSKIYAGNQLVFSSAWTPADLGADLALWLDATDTDTITVNGPNVSQWDDKSDNQLVVTQSVADQQPAYTTGEKVTFDRINDTMTVTMPATTGTLVLATANGTAAYGVIIPAGSYSIGGHNIGYMPDGPVIGQIITSTAMSQADIDAAISYLRDKGAGQDYGSVTNFTSFWHDWSELTSFPLIDTSAGTNFEFAWRNCASLTSFPLIDTSAGKNFSSAWFNCTSLTSFPLIDTSAGTNFYGAWYNCASLTSFPLIDTSAGTNFNVAWFNCTSLTSFPLIDTSAGTNFNAAWFNCTSLTSFPLIDTSAGKNFSSAWFNCTSLTSFPLIDTSAGTNFQVAWYNCSSLTSFPLINTSAGTNFYAAWYGCNSLTSFPLIDTSAGTNFQQSWQFCSSLTSFPANFFDNCPANNFNNAFSNTNLSQESIDNILVSIESNNTSNGKFNQSGGSAPSTVGQAAITAMRNRGWIITVTGGF